MMNIFFKSIIFILIFSSQSLYSNGKTHELNIFAEDIPPFVYGKKDFIPRGIGVEIVRYVAKQLNHSGEMEILSWNRAYKWTRDKSNNVLFPMSRTKARENLFKWVGPLFKSTSYLYKRKGNPMEVNSLEDAKNVLAISVVRNYASHQYLVDNDFKNLVDIGHTGGVIRSMVFNRASLISAGDIFLRFRAKQAGVDYRLIKNTGVKLLEQTQYVAFSKSTPDSVIQQWQNIFNKIKQNGVYDKIFQRELKKAIEFFDKEDATKGAFFN